MAELKRLILSLTARQSVSLVVAAIVVAGGLWSLARWNQERDFRPLYTALAPEDAGAVVARLRESGVAYRVSDGGASVLVPSTLVAETRLGMAASGLPRSGRIGFELFDQSNFGTTDFAEQVNYHRALEGELERSAMALSELARARVHITLAKDSVFLESQRPAKASVLVELRPGADLSGQNVLAIQHLVSSAVEGLEPKAVSILDMRGNLLSRPRSNGNLDLDEPSDAIIDFRQSIERDLLTKIGSTLEPLLGPDGFRASVSVECDFRSGEQSEEFFDPSRSVMTRSERTEDFGGAGDASGVPGTASNLPRPTSRPGSAPNSHTTRSENITFQTSRTVTRTSLPQGELQRISAALLVDHSVRWEGEGVDARRIVEPPSEEQLRSIRELVSGAIGLNPERGDQLIVETLPFESTRNWQPPEAVPPASPPDAIPLPPWIRNLVGDNTVLLITGIGGGLAVALVLLAGIFLALRRIRKGGKITAVGTTKALSGADMADQAESSAHSDVETKMQERLAEHAALKAQLEGEALRSLKVPTVKTKKTEVLSKHITEEAQNNPENMANLLRTWLNEDGA